MAARLSGCLPEAGRGALMSANDSSISRPLKWRPLSELVAALEAPEALPQRPAAEAATTSPPASLADLRAAGRARQTASAGHSYPQTTTPLADQVRAEWRLAKLQFRRKGGKSGARR
jgi:hypothetical protein